jgi:hypothetical protein
LFALYPQAEGAWPTGAFRPQVNTIMPCDIQVTGIVRCGFSGNKNQVFLRGYNLLYIQARPAVVLHKVFSSNYTGIFRLFSYRGPDKAVFMTFGPIEIIDDQAAQGIGCLGPSSE